jgi:hypothetical protein
MSTHAFSNGTSAQLTVELNEDLHVYIGGALRLVATKEEVSLFLSDLQSWAVRVFPVESQGTNGAPVMSTPEPSAVPVVPGGSPVVPGVDLGVPPESTPADPQSSPVVPQSSPEQDELPSPLETRPALVDDLTASIEMVLAIFINGKPTAAELARAVDGVSRGLFADALEQAGEMIPPHLKPVFDVLRSL